MKKFAVLSVKTLAVLGLLVSTAHAYSGEFILEDRGKHKRTEIKTIQCKSDLAVVSTWKCNGRVDMGSRANVYAYCYNPNGSPSGSFRPAHTTIGDRFTYTTCKYEGYGNAVELKFSCKTNHVGQAYAVFDVTCNR